MSGFRNYTIVFLVGGVLGFMIAMLIFCKNHNVNNITTTLLVEKNADEILSAPTTNIKQNHKNINILTKIETPHYGTLSLSQTIPRDSLQYKYSFGVESGYWVKSQLPFLGVSFSYKHYLVSAKVGYSLMLREIDFGVGVGMNFRF